MFCLILNFWQGSFANRQNMAEFYSIFFALLLLKIKKVSAQGLRWVL